MNSRILRIIGNRKTLRKWFVFFCIVITSLFTATVITYALDSVVRSIAPGASVETGSNNNTLWFSTGTTSTGSQYYINYINKDNDSTTISNYLIGYYYDTQYGLFRLDWDATNPNNNVRIIDSTDKCTTGYGYKLGGFARGAVYDGTIPDAGFFNFNYSEDIFVYYCESDGKLHGTAYDLDYGFQSFEGIQFDVMAKSDLTPAILGNPDPFFVNNNSILLLPSVGWNSVQGDEAATDWGKSSTFYIIK